MGFGRSWQDWLMELDKYQKIFIQESSKYLDELDAALIKVEKDLQNQQLWGDIHGQNPFREGNGQSPQHDGSGHFLSCHGVLV